MISFAALIIALLTLRLWP
ncbi:hypothetical protein [Paenibacillus oralis]